jgi:8-oxo-dGTP pyrophosphatase MutT (NUDIX family)
MTSRRWERNFSEVLSRTKHFSLRHDRVVNPRNQSELDTYVLECADWVNIVALTPADEIVLVRQFRHGIGKASLEIPGGTVNPGEAPELAAKRELLEETGYVPEELILIGSLDAQPALQNNRLHTFLALGSTLGASPDPDEGEDISVEIHPAGNVDSLVRSGEISHALVLSAFHWWNLWKR